MSDWQEDFTLLDVALLLVRKRLFLFLVFLGSAILAAGLVLLVPNRYTATTTILPPQQNTSSSSSLLLSQLSGSLGSLGAMAGQSLIKNPNEMYVSLLKTETVEFAVIRRFDLQTRYHAKKLSRARKKLESNCKIEAGIKDGLIRLSISDQSPEFAAQLANAYIEEFKRQSDSLAITEAGQRRIFFEQQRMDAENKLTNAEEALKETEQKTGMLELTGQSRALIESVAALRAQLAAREVELNTVQSYATDQNPDTLRLQREVAGIQAQLKRLAGTAAGADSGEPTDQLLLTNSKVPAAALEYLRKLRDVRYYESILEFLEKQLEVARIDEAKQGAVIQVVDPAMVPDTKSSPWRAVVVLVSACVGLFAAMFWIVGRAMWIRVKQLPQIQSRLNTASNARAREETSKAAG